MAGELAELATEDFEIFLIYPYGKLVFSLRIDSFQIKVHQACDDSQPAPKAPHI